MNKSHSIKITFHFPNFSGKSRGAFVKALVKNLSLSPHIGYAGFLHKKGLQKHLTQRYSQSDIGTYQPLPLVQERKIKRTLLATTQKTSRLLSPPEGRVLIFVFPLIGPFDDYDKAMGFSSGFCPYKNTILIFLSPKLFVDQSLKSSLAHEYNHALFFNYHDIRLTLLETIVFEGLAENFEEEVVGTAPPYATTLTSKEARKTLNSMSSQLLCSKSQSAYQQVFFGGKKYKKWTGYSIGYWIVRLFRKKKHNFSWQDIMKMEPLEIAKVSDFIKKD